MPSAQTPCRCVASAILTIMDSSNSQRRLRALQAQFEQSPAGVAHGGVARQNTVAKLQREYNYDLQSVALPEKLTPKGPWLVHR